MFLSSLVRQCQFQSIKQIRRNGRSIQRNERSFSTKETRVDFDRPKEKKVGGTVKPTDYHLFVSMRDKPVEDWPFEFGPKASEDPDATFFTRLKGILSGSLSNPSFQITAFQESNEWWPEYDGRDLVIFSKENFPGHSFRSIRLKNVADSNLSDRIQEFFNGGKSGEEGEEWDNISKERFLFVCAHGSRDGRCGYCGPILINMLQDRIKERGLSGKINVRGCSHVGGHEFAGNVLVYPEGDWFGYVSPQQVDQLIDFASKEGSESFKDHSGSSSSSLQNFWRGNSYVTQENQLKKIEEWSKD